MKVFDNIINDTYQNYISDQLTSDIFPWYYTDNATIKDKDKNSAFSNQLFLNADERQHKNPYCDCLYPLLFE